MQFLFPRTKSPAHGKRRLSLVSIGRGASGFSATLFRDSTSELSLSEILSSSNTVVITKTHKTVSVRLLPRVTRYQSVLLRGIKTLERKVAESTGKRHPVPAEVY